jgi:hypothetical protein
MGFFPFKTDICLPLSLPLFLDQRSWEASNSWMFNDYKATGISLASTTKPVSA